MSEAVIEEITVIWAQALNVEPSAIDTDTSNFFDLGGHSMLAMQVITKVIKRFQDRLPEDTFDVESALLYTIFDEPAVRQFADCLLANGLRPTPL